MGKKGKLHGYKSGSELFAHVSEPSIRAGKKSDEDMASGVNRSATATKVKSVKDKVKNDIVVLKEEGKGDGSFSNGKSSKEQHRSNEESKSKMTGTQPKVSVKLKSSAPTSLQCDTTFDKLKNDNAQDRKTKTQCDTTFVKMKTDSPEKKPSNVQTQDRKAKTLERLIKKAGVEEKLKDFKTTPTTASEIPIQSSTSAQAASKPRFEARNKISSEKKIQPSKQNFSSKSVITTKSALSMSKSVTGEKAVKENDIVGQIESEKCTKQENVTNQKRKQILSGKHSAKTSASVNPKPCDEEVKKWIESLRLKRNSEIYRSFWRT